MLYVNDQANDLLWDGPVDPEWIRSFGAAEYPVLTVANGDRVIAAGHPAENGSFQRFIRAAGHDDLIDDPRLATQLQRKEHIGEILGTLPRLGRVGPRRGHRRGRADGRRDGGRTGAHAAAAVCDTDWAAAREVTTHVSDRGSRSHPHPQLAMALRRQRPRHRRAGATLPR